VLGQALAVAQNDGRALARRQRLKGVKKLILSVYPAKLAVVLSFSAPPATREGSLPLQPTEVVFRQVDDRALQVEAERFWVSKILEPPEQSHKGVLSEIFGQVSVPGKQIGELNGISSMLLVEVSRSPSTQGHGRLGRIQHTRHSPGIS
jgi:hypothetical protein